MLFKDVIGQKDVKQQLIEMVQNNRLSHALLFLGKEGSGALSLAMAFAEYVSLLPNKTLQETSLFGEPVEIKLPSTAEEADAWMQKQSSFNKAEQLVHPDIHYSYPVVSSSKKKKDLPIEKKVDEKNGDEKTKGNRAIDFIEEWRQFIKQRPYGNVSDWVESIKETVNQQGKITANECYDIVRKISLKSFESSYKILILWMPEMLAKEANILLKSLEEPPPDTLFILVAENEGLVLPTILSRCQLIKIPALESNDIEQSLLSKKSCSPEQAKQIANASEGNFREALNLLQHADE